MFLNKKKKKNNKIVGVEKFIMHTFQSPYLANITCHDT